MIRFLQTTRFPALATLLVAQLATGCASDDDISSHSQELGGPTAVLGVLAEAGLDNAKSFGADFIFEQIFGTNTVTLSEQSLQSISNIVGEQLEDWWWERDKKATQDLFDEAPFYARTSNLVESTEYVTSLSADATNVASYLTLYGMKAAPTYQAVASLNCQLNRERLELMIARGESQQVVNAARDQLAAQAQRHVEALDQFEAEFLDYTNSQYYIDQQFLGTTGGQFCWSNRYRYCVKGPQNYKWCGAEYHVSTCRPGDGGGSARWSEADAHRRQKVAALRSQRRDDVLTDSFTANRDSFRTLAADSTTAAVRLYEHCGYGGATVALNVGTYDLGDLAARGLANDSLSSLQVPPGYRVTVYEHGGYGGWSRVFDANASCLVDQGINDRVSSVRVDRL